MYTSDISFTFLKCRNRYNGNKNYADQMENKTKNKERKEKVILKCKPFGLIIYV